VGSEPATLVDDLPGGSPRLIADAIGVVRVLVNGVETIADGKPTGNLPPLTHERTAMPATDIAPDPYDIYLIHRVFRREFPRLAGDIASALAAGDSGRSAALVDTGPCSTTSSSTTTTARTCCCGSLLESGGGGRGHRRRPDAGRPTSSWPAGGGPCRPGAVDRIDLHC
jgi:hypothetical protein